MYKKEAIIGYEDYQVDTNGIIYSKSGNPLKPSSNPKGYQIVVFSINGKTKAFGVHQLVARQFIINVDPQNKTQVNHIDGNKSNNRAENLEWTTPKENVLHSVKVLKNNVGIKNGNAKSIYGIDKQTNGVKYEFDSISDAARFFVKLNKNPNYVKSTLWKALNGDRKSYKNCIWKYR